MKTPSTNKTVHKETKPRLASYEAPRHLEIPNEVLERFENDGYDLKWIRIIDPKTNGVDLKNIAKRQRQGYEPVTHAEIKSLDFQGVSELFGRGSDAKTKDYLVINDVALFKVPIEVKEQRQQWVDNESWRQINDLRRSFGENIGGKMNSTFKQKNVSFAKDASVEIEE